MKTLVLILLGLGLCVGCDQTNVGLAIDAGADAVRAATLSDKEVAQLAARACETMDSEQRIALPGSDPARRLDRLTRNFRTAQGRNFNFRVYLAPEVNAFALADGSIRIYSGLMDRMTDPELLFVLGHEMGHVLEDHAKKKMRVAYAASALRKGVASQENLAGAIAASALGGLVQTLANAQFSQAEEAAADDAGLWLLMENGFTRSRAVAVAAGALEKLSGPSRGLAMLATHPEPAKRAERIRRNLNGDDPGPWAGILEKITAWAGQVWERFGPAPVREGRGS